MGIGAAVAVGVGVAAAAGGSAASASAKKKAAKKMKKEAERSYSLGEAYRQSIDQRMMAETGLATQNLSATEQAKANIFGALGKPGTYGYKSPLGTSGPIGMSGLTPQGLSPLGTATGSPGGAIMGKAVTKEGAVTAKDVGSKWTFGDQKWKVEGQELDPNAIAGQAMESESFKTVSGMVAEAQQLMNREGPLWDELNHSVVGGIYESSAGIHRQMMDDLARTAAQGGSASRQAQASVGRMRAQEAVNRTRTQALWSSKLQMEQWTHAYAQNTMKFAQDWTNNLFGVRDEYTSALTNLRTMWSQTMPIALMQAQMGAGGKLEQGKQASIDMALQATQTKIAGIVNAVSSVGNLAGGMGGMVGGAGAGGGGGMFSGGGY